MTTTFVLHALRMDDSPFPCGRSRFAALPIRIGRNALNDFHVAQGFVSDFHARIEEVQGKICIRDLSSKNGIYVHAEQQVPARIPPQTPIDLGPYGFQFYLGPQLRIQLQFVQTERPFRDSVFQGSVLGNPDMLHQSGSNPIVQGFGPSAGALPAASWPLPAPAPAAAGYAPGGGYASPGAPPLPPLGSGAQAPGQSYPPQPAAPGYAAHPGDPAAQGWSQAPQPAAAAYISKKTAHFSIGVEALALQGLRELAVSLVPGKPLETTGDVARFITKLHDAIEVFCRCFIPLREGYSQFVSSLDLQRAALQRGNYRSPAYAAVETAPDPEAVAVALLDWRDSALDAPQAVEGIFADLMVHQVALLDGVMQGVRALLEELSPENIEAACSAERSAGLGLPFGRHKAIWQTYRDRHAELSEERQAFAHIFGPEFTEAYREYRRRRTENDQNQ